MKGYSFKEEGDNDIELFVKAETEPEIFEAVNEYLAGLRVSNSDKKNEKVKISLTAESLKDLVVKYINEIIYLYEVKGFWPLSARFSLKKKELLAEIKMSRKNKLKRGLKSATYHNLNLKKTKEGFEFKVLIDI